MPIIRFQKRISVPRGARIVTALAAIVLSLLLGAVLLYASGHSPLEAYGAMLKGSFGSAYGVGETVVKAIPLLLAALAAAVAYQMKLWTIGMEGQIYMGAFAASGVALALGYLPASLLIPLMLISGFAAGAMWGLLAGALKAFWQVNETISTLMMNYIAILWVSFLIFGPWKDPESFNFPLSPRFSENASLPTLGDSRVHLGLIIGLVLAFVLWLVFNYSRWGFEIKVIGESPDAARYAGMNITRNILVVMLISGGIAGLAGMLEVSGVTHRLQQGVSPGYGYSGIIVAWLGRLHPLVIVFVSLLFGGLLVGGYSIQLEGVPFSLVQVLQGAILFFLLSGEFFVEHRPFLVRKGGSRA